MSKEFQERFAEYLDNHNVTNGIRLKRFPETLKTNISFMNYEKRLDPSYIERRNPLIVALGDSVTCGHFEAVENGEWPFAQEPDDSYVAQFTRMLRKGHQLSTINLINSGLAGDNIFGMYKRVERDVIAYDPDLVILNASLNWPERLGDVEVYKEYYRRTIDKIIDAGLELILMTSNPTLSDPVHKERTAFIRDLAYEKQLPMVDIYRIFEDVLAEEEWKDVLANGENHPTLYGHTIMAKALMQLFEE